jgi:hypothetical protein
MGGRKVLGDDIAKRKIGRQRTEQRSQRLEPTRRAAQAEDLLNSGYVRVRTGRALHAGSSTFRRVRSAQRLMGVIAPDGMGPSGQQRIIQRKEGFVRSECAALLR